MKQIIIFLLVIILALVGYGKYKQYKRFSAPQYEYTKSDKLDLNYHNQEFLLDYHEAVEDLNSYVITQWTANKIDVRAPKDLSAKEEVAIKQYAKKLAKVKFYEAQLVKSSVLKESGLINEDIKLIESTGLNLKQHKQAKHSAMIKSLFLNKPILKIGERNALVFELQKLLIKKGYDIPIDGMFADLTLEALKTFEEKSGLFSDGKLDMLTLEQLLK